jgi:oligoribonuclease NrnB/cAMP/cGMP phosphodiesterase (DHH superfamily)
MKVKLFTHTDLDGVGCAIVAKTAFENIDIEYCDYGEINEKIVDFLENDRPTDYDRIFITDISFNDEVAEKLDMIHRGGVSGVQLVDHHGTALHLAEKYPNWCHVRVEESNLYRGLDSREKVASSGTSLFFKFLRDKHLPNVEFNQTLKAFVETVRKYDTWEWHNIYKDDHPKRLNDLLYLVGRENFLARFSRNPLAVFTESELQLLAVEEYRINKYIWNKKREVKTDSILIDGICYTYAYVFAEQYGSILGNAIAEDCGLGVDFVALIDMSANKVSIRGIHDDLDLGKDVAKVLGNALGGKGGGHKKACAFTFEEALTKSLVDIIFEDVEEDK